jgi:hypothetical protein
MPSFQAADSACPLVRKNRRRRCPQQEGMVRLGSRYLLKMDSAGRKSNHDFDANVKKMAEQLISTLCKHDTRSDLTHLVKKLQTLRTSDAQPRATLSRRQRPHRPGWVIEAVLQVLDDRREPMRAKDIHSAVEALLGESVCWGSVKNALASNITGPSPKLVRIARGRYVVA